MNRSEGLHVSTSEEAGLAQIGSPFLSALRKVGTGTGMRPWLYQHQEGKG